jgi:hypothetical protein
VPGLGKSDTERPEYHLVLEISRPTTRNGPAEVGIVKYTNNFGLGISNFEYTMSGWTDNTGTVKITSPIHHQVYLRGGLKHYIRSNTPLTITYMLASETYKKLTKPDGVNDVWMKRIVLDTFDSGTTPASATGLTNYITPGNAQVLVPYTHISSSEPPVGDWGCDGIRHWIVNA